MKQHFPRWPTRSPDPWANILLVTVFLFFGLLMLASSLILMVPVGIGFAVIAVLRWYHFRPQGYSNQAIAAAVNQHTIAANFPDTATFAHAYIGRLIDAWHPHLPIPPVLGGIAQVAADIYNIEAFTNPLPPLPSDEVDQGRWRDEARVHAQKMHDAPGTIALFTEVLTQSLSVFRNALPGPVLMERSAFASWGDRVPALTMPAQQLIHDPESFTEAIASPFFGRSAVDLRLFRELRAGLELRYRRSGLLLLQDADNLFLRVSPPLHCPSPSWSGL